MKGKMHGWLFGPMVLQPSVNYSINLPFSVTLMFTTCFKALESPGTLCTLCSSTWLLLLPGAGHAAQAGIRCIFTTNTAGRRLGTLATFSWDFIFALDKDLILPLQDCRRLVLNQLFDTTERIKLCIYLVSFFHF